MKQYLMIFRNEKLDGPLPSAEQMQAALQQWQNWIGGLAKQGSYADTNRLFPIGKTLKPGNVITDGPYIESREMVGGYLLVKANSLDEAITMAQSCPNLQYGGNVEVREVMAIDGDPKSRTFLHEKN